MQRTIVREVIDQTKGERDPRFIYDQARPHVAVEWYGDTSGLNGRVLGRYSQHKAARARIQRERAKSRKSQEG